MTIKQYGVVIVNLDPTIGHEIQKTRPCLVISPDEMNSNIQTIIVAPITTSSKNYPTRIKIQTPKTTGWIVLDQIRTIDKKRIIQFVDHLQDQEIIAVKGILKEMLVD